MSGTLLPASAPWAAFAGASGLPEPLGWCRLVAWCRQTFRVPLLSPPHFAHLNGGWGVVAPAAAHAAARSVRVHERPAAVLLPPAPRCLSPSEPAAGAGRSRRRKRLRRCRRDGGSPSVHVLTPPCSLRARPQARRPAAAHAALRVQHIHVLPVGGNARDAKWRAAQHVPRNGRGIAG